MTVIKKTVAIILAVTMAVTGFLSVGTGSTTAAKKAKLAKKSISVSVGKKKSIKIKNKRKRCNYSFKSSKPKVAKVTKKGVVTGKKAGKAVITVKETVKSTKKKRTLGKVNVRVTPKKSDDTGDKTGGATDVPPAIVTASSPAAPTEEPSVNLDIDFSNGDISRFHAQGDGVKIMLDPYGYNDESCLKATGREQRNDWFGCGMAMDITDVIKPGRTYKVSSYVRCDKDATITLRSVNVSGGGGGFGWNWPSQVGDTIEVKGGQWAYMEAIYAAPDVINNKISLYWDASSTADIFIDSIEFKRADVLDNTFKTLFTDIFGHVGTCNTYSQMRNNKGFTTTLYNSVTMENETKPQSYLNKGNISSKPPEGYIIPESYKDTKYPVLNFQGFDDVINTAYEYGLSIRFHVLVWHSQTPRFFFKKNYDEDMGNVSKEVMEGRLEYYVRNVVNHIYNTPHGKDVVYCIDVANEYFHNYDQGQKPAWNAIYYPEEKSEAERTNKPEYIKHAFEYTYDELEKLGLAGKIKLFYNDYNTYEKTDDIITLINYINSERKICNGVGMQSHLDVDYPSPKMNVPGDNNSFQGQHLTIAQTIDAFNEQGFEIQITELDVTDYDNSGKQLQYYKDLFNTLIIKKKNGANITGVTFWGLCDSNSWRRSGKPLLFSAVFSPKPVFYEVINTAKEAWH